MQIAEVNLKRLGSCEMCYKYNTYISNLLGGLLEFETSSASYLTLTDLNKNLENLNYYLDSQGYWNV